MQLLAGWSVPHPALTLLPPPQRTVQCTLVCSAACRACRAVTCQLLDLCPKLIIVSLAICKQHIPHLPNLGAPAVCPASSLLRCAATLLRTLPFALRSHVDAFEKTCMAILVTTSTCKRYGTGCKRITHMTAYTLAHAHTHTHTTAHLLWV